MFGRKKKTKQKNKAADTSDDATWWDKSEDIV